MEITAKTIKSLKKNTNSVIDQLADLYETENKVANEIVSLQEQIKELQAAIDEDKATLVSLAKEKESLTSELVAQLDEVKNTCQIQKMCGTSAREAPTDRRKECKSERST